MRASPGNQIGVPAANEPAENRPSASPRAGWLEISAILGLGLVWPLGVIALWRSRVWSRQQKLIGTLVVPTGYAIPLITAVLVARTFTLPWLCTSTYSDSGQLLSSNCPPDLVLAVEFWALTVIVNLLIWAVPLLQIASGVYLTTRAWRSAASFRPVLVLAAVVGPVVAIAATEAAFLSLPRSQPAQPITGGPVVTSQSPLPNATPDLPAFPNLTTSQLRGALTSRGFSCGESATVFGTWSTSCSQGASSVVAIGKDDRSVQTVMATFTGSSAAGRSQFIDAVALSVSPPAAAESISTWAAAHASSGGQTDINGYLVIVNTLDGATFVIINRTQP